MKYKIKKVIEVQDWDALVQQTYGKVYSFQQQDDCKQRGVEEISTGEEYLEDYGNDTIPEVINGQKMGVSFKAWLARDPKTPLNPTKEELKECGYYWGKTEEDEKEWKEDMNHINMFWERNFYPYANMIANDLCKKGLLEKGDYLINIDW